jgi:hypothetical protein
MARQDAIMDAIDVKYAHSDAVMEAWLEHEKAARALNEHDAPVEIRLAAARSGAASLRRLIELDFGRADLEAMVVIWDGLVGEEEAEIRYEELKRTGGLTDEHD